LSCPLFLTSALPESSDKPRHRERSVAISPFPLRLPRTLRVLAMTLSNRIYASYRWIGALPDFTNAVPANDLNA
jgi:hypothetical protein